MNWKSNCGQGLLLLGLSVPLWAAECPADFARTLTESLSPKEREAQCSKEVARRAELARQAEAQKARKANANAVKAEAEADAARAEAERLRAEKARLEKELAQAKAVNSPVVGKPTSAVQNPGSAVVTSPRLEVGAVSEWREGETYEAGAQVTYKGKQYKASTRHTAYVGAGWNPASTPTLWSEIAAGASSSASRVASAQTQTFTVNGVSFTMVAIPAGSFMMGSPDSEPGRDKNEGPQRRVTIQPFQMGQTEVTQGLWQAVMGNNPSYFKDCGATCPVEQVSWNEIQGFIKKLNQLTGQTFRLPSEAEWEYAARAGCTTPFNVGGQCRDKIEASEANFVGNYTYNGSAKGEYREKTLPVASFAANGFGLFDLHGNVREWVQDCYVNSYAGARSDGGAVETGSCQSRVLRGGSWFDYPQGLRAAYRNDFTPDSRFIGIGFRLARTLP